MYLNIKYRDVFNCILFSAVTLIVSGLMPSLSAAAVTPAMSTPKLTISGQSTFNAWWFTNHDVKTRNDADFGNGLKADGTPLPGDTQKGHGRGYLFTMDDSRLKFDACHIPGWDDGW